MGADADANRGRLQLIATPIGNLSDLTFRAVDCLKNADIIACEDTRHSRKLLAHYEIPASNLTSLHDHNEKTKAAVLAGKVLEEGAVLAMISDAGTPVISDPGYRLVRECIARGVKVEVIPGPSAVIAALVGSGLPSGSFCFRGFLPVKKGKKEKALRAALESKETTIFFESPYRIIKTLRLLSEIGGEEKGRSLCVARELTKKFETFHRGTADEIAEQLGAGPVKGEITLLIAGKPRK